MQKKPKMEALVRKSNFPAINKLPKLRLKDNPLQQFISLGTKGHYPLFYQNWIAEELHEALKNPTDLEFDGQQVISCLNDIVSRLKEHKSLERKKTVLLSLTKNERAIFIKTFFDLVESKMLESGTTFH